MLRRGGALKIQVLTVEIGIHRFHHPGEPGNIGEAKFITLWPNKDGVWKVTRAISYDHEPVGK